MSEQAEEQGGQEEAGGGVPPQDDDAIARRAFEISESEDAGTPEENWLRAERELRGGAGGEGSPTE
jgi:hypothetical protein